MSDLEELKRRKEQLILERDIARLERRKRWGNFANGWRWFWVAPVALIGAIFFFVGLANIKWGSEFIVTMILGAVATFPLMMKVLMKR